MRGAGDVDELPGDEMVGGDLGADVDQVLRAHPELDHLALGLHRGGGEVAALRLRRVLDLGKAGAELHGACSRSSPTVRWADDLAAVELEHGHRHLLAGVGEQAGHADLLCDHA